MGDFLAMGIILVGFIVLKTIMAKKEDEPKVKQEESIPFTQAIKEKACPPHKWTYQNKEEGTGMHCSECKMIPGYEGR